MYGRANHVIHLESDIENTFASIPDFILGEIVNSTTDILDLPKALQGTRKQANVHFPTST